MPLQRFFVCVTFVGLLFYHVQATCMFNVLDLPKTLNAPMLLYPTRSANQQTFYRYREPNSDGRVSLSRGDKISIACPGSGNRITPGGRGAIFDTVCGPNGQITGVANIKDLECLRNFSARAAQLAGTCGNNGKAADIRFDVPNQRPSEPPNPLVVYRLCYESNFYTPRYTRHDILGSVISNRCGSRPHFRSAGFVPDLFTDYQRSSSYLERTLGTNSYNTGNFLSKGHLVPRCDFAYSSQQESTMFYENLAPQWYSFNSGNWEKVEYSVRRLALTKRQLQITTGTWGISALKGANGKTEKLFLNGNEHVPVPSYFWKVVYNPANKRGAAIFGSNNPFESVNDRESIVPRPCQRDVCNELRNWLRFEHNNLTAGEIFCCAINDINLTPAISGFPRGSVVQGLLTA